MRNKVFLFIKVVLTLASLFGVLFFSNSICANVSIKLPCSKEILYDISMGIFSSMILVWCIDEISKHIQERQSRQKEITLIKRFDRVLQLYIDQYITMFYCVATPITVRKFDEVKMPEHFSLKDMRDLHQVTLLVKEGFLSGSVDEFLHIELELRKELISLTQRYSFEYYPQIVQIFIDYIQESIKYDCRAGIASNKAQMKSDKTFSTTIRKLLEEHGEEYYNKALDDDNFPATIIHPYIYLYEMMKYERELILRYQAEISLIYETTVIARWFTKVIDMIKKGVRSLNQIKIKLFFAKHGKWIFSFCALGLSCLAFVICRKLNVLERMGKWSGETKAILGTILGAVIGGVFTLLGSSYVNKQQLMAQTHIKRKNLIYKPLYDEIASIENDILSGNPYPSRIVFKIEECRGMRYPQYTVWDRIKSDTRYLETPQSVIYELEKLYSTIQSYLEVRCGNNDEMTEFMNEILLEVLGSKSTIQNLGDCIIEFALLDSQEDVYDMVKFGLENGADVSKEQQRKINELFYERSSNKETIQKIKRAKQEWDSQQQKVISLLTDLIQYVNIKYEG